MESNFEFDLIQQITNENKKREVFDILYKNHVKGVYKKCLILLSNEQNAQDMTQEIFFKVFTKLHTYKGKSRFSTWLFRITHNACLNELKKKKIKMNFELVDERTPEIVVEAPENTSININTFNKIIRELNPTDQYLLNTRYYDGIKVKKMAEILEVSESALKMRLQRLRHKIAKRYQQLNYE